jgi:hypothetical protein
LRICAKHSESERNISGKLGFYAVNCLLVDKYKNFAVYQLRQFS